MTTARHAEGDGETEQRNITVEQVLRAFVDYDQDNWDELLLFAEFSINSSRQAVTELTPMFVVHGHEPVLPNILLNPRAAHTNKSLAEFLSSHANTIQQVRDSPTSAQDAMAAHVNCDRHDVTFKADDLVMISANMLTTDFECNRTSDKLSDHWLGPFKILQALSLVTYRVELPGYIRAHNVFHICNLKAYIARPDELPRSGPVENTDITDNYHAVDKIIKHRMRGNKYQYLVKYTGYANAESEWIGEDDFIGDIIQNYWDWQLKVCQSLQCANKLDVQPKRWRHAMKEPKLADVEQDAVLAE